MSEVKEPLRVNALKTAKIFKSSWIDMAALLSKIAARGAYEVWGFETLEDYAAEELNIKAATVKKLLGSYSTLKRVSPTHAESGAKNPPSMDAVQYFEKALGPEESSNNVKKEVVTALRDAVFEEGQSVAVLRKNFNPILFPTSERDDKIKRLTKVKNGIRKLDTLLASDLGIDEGAIERAQRALANVLKDVERQIQSNQEKKSKTA